MDEVLLVKQCLQGKAEAQRQLYELHAPRMLGVCYRYARSLEEAEDFLQDVFIIIFRKLEQFKNQGSLEGWIYRVTINTCLNQIKARHPIGGKTDLEALPDHALSVSPDDHKTLIELIRRLPDGYRTVFNLHAIEGYSHEEIAAMLGITSSTSRSQYLRAREQLANMLGLQKHKNENKS